MKLFKSIFGRVLLLPFIFLCATSAQAKPPNIVFILADDLNEEVFSHSDKINSLITAHGIKFRNHMVSLSLCCPSRATILRGQYAHNTGIFTNKPPQGGFEKFFADGLEKSTVAAWLKAAGYRTALFGKYLNGYPSLASGTSYIPPGWNYWISPNGGTPYFEYRYSLNENGVTVPYGSTEKDYLDDVLSQKAAKFIKNSVVYHPNKPFFMYIASYAPHQPADPPRRYANDFPGLKAPRPASFNEADVSDKPAWAQANGLLTDSHIETIDKLYRKRRLSMQAIGDMVEQLVNTLMEVGEIDNTYIFFTSDNGFHQGQHRLWSGKNTGFEEDINVPLVVRGPGVPVGEVVNDISANVDFAPTFAEIAGIKPPKFVDGRSLLPFLKGAKPSVWRKVLLLEHSGPSITPPNTPNGLLEPPDPYDIQVKSNKYDTGENYIFLGLRTQQHAIGTYGAINYIKYDTGETELYNLSTDPLQLNNVNSTASPVLKTKLDSWLSVLRGASGQALRNAEQTAP